MNKKQLLVFASVASSVYGITGAGASTVVSIGASVGGGAIITEGSGTGIASAIFAMDGYAVNSVTGLAAVPPDIFNSGSQNEVNVGANVLGPLSIFVTAQGLTSPIGGMNLLSSFTSNSLPAGWTVTETTWLDLGNGLFSEATALGSSTFTAIGTGTKTALENLVAPYSLTEVYTITPSGPGNSNSTIDISGTPISNTPVPATLPLLAGGLLGFWALTKRRRFSLP